MNKLRSLRYSDKLALTGVILFMIGTPMAVLGKEYGVQTLLDVGGAGLVFALGCFLCAALSSNHESKYGRSRY